MTLLNIDEILAAAELISGKQGNSYTNPGKQGCFPCINDKKQIVKCDFEGWETRETDFRGGVGANYPEHSENRQNNPIPPQPPKEGRNREKSAGSTIDVSLVSHEREYQCLCGVEADKTGKQHCFPVFPMFPTGVEPSPELEPLIERAAIMEYDGGLSRAEAESKALETFTGWTMYHRGGVE